MKNKTFIRKLVSLFICLTLLLGTAVIVNAEIYTFYQSGKDYDSRLHIPVDGAMQYFFDDSGLFEVSLSRIPDSFTKMAMISFTHDFNNYYTSGKYDGSAHSEIIQKRSDGSLIQHMGIHSFVTPTTGWIGYLKSMVQGAIYNGAKVIIIEEPEVFGDAGYDDAFKSEWLSYYGSQWVDPQTSESAFMMASELREYLLQRVVDEVFSYAKSEDSTIKCYVAAHSAPSYFNWKVPFGYNLAMGSQYCDGFVGQTWSNTMDTAVLYEGGLQKLPFENGYFEYSYYAQLGKAYPNKDLITIMDPKGDGYSNKSWDWLLDMYIKQAVSSLMQSSVYRYSTVIWPERIMGIDENEAPDTYKTIMSNMMSVLRDMHNYTAEITTDNKPIKVGMLISDTTCWQAGGPSNTANHDSVNSLVMPLLNRGLMVDGIPLEGITTSANILNDYDVIYLSYDIMKHQDDSYNIKIRDWINNGGTAVYFGGRTPYENISNQWWKVAGYASPQDHLMSILGCGLSGRNTSITASSLSPESGSSMAQSIGTIPSTNGYNMIGYSSGTGITPLYKIDSNIVSFQKNYGSGEFIYFGLDPYYFGSSATGSSKMFNIIQSVSSSLRATTISSKDYVEYERGPYMGIDSLRGTRIVTGEYIDLFDPNLSIIRRKEVSEGKAALLYDISDITISNIPKVLFAQGTAPAITETSARTTVVVEGSTNTLGAIRILSKDGIVPNLATAIDSNGTSTLHSQEWDDLSKSLLIKYWNHTDGITVQVDWSTSGSPTTQYSKNVDDRSTSISYSGSWTNVDQFLYIDDRDTNLSYSGPWYNWSDSQDYNGTEKFSNTTNSSVEFTFTGSTITWISSLSTNLGIANVYIDNVFKESVDLYSLTKQYQRPVFKIEGLSNEEHTIKIEVSGNKNPAASDSNIVIDGFYGAQGAYEKTEKSSNTSNSYAEYTFDGNDVRWIGSTGPSFGKADVYIDGVLSKANIDLYSERKTYKQGLYSKTGLSEGNHTIKIVVKGTKNSSSSNYDVLIDQLEFGFSTLTKIDDRDNSLTYNGSWYGWTDSQNYNSTETFSDITANNVEFQFTGNVIRWIGPKGSNMGMADVYIDGVLKQAGIDLYSPTKQYQQVLFSDASLEDGTHTIGIIVKGAKNISSSGYAVAIDNFEYK